MIRLRSDHAVGRRDPPGDRPDTKAATHAPSSRPSSHSRAMHPRAMHRRADHRAVHAPIEAGTLLRGLRGASPGPPQAPGSPAACSTGRPRPRLRGWQRGPPALPSGGSRRSEEEETKLFYRSSPHRNVKGFVGIRGGIRLAALWRGLLGVVGGARNLINNMVFKYPPRSGGASLEGWEGHEA